MAPLDFFQIDKNHLQEGQKQVYGGNHVSESCAYQQAELVIFSPKGV